jgi:hypothetical protein
MAQAIKSALPSHLKSQLGGKDSDAEFTGRHHGKTRSHMVSSTASSIHHPCAPNATVESETYLSFFVSRLETYTHKET